MNTSEKYYWLNEKSLNFLSQDYLPPGVSPQERIMHIAKSAQEYLKLDGFANKFEEYMSRGFYSLSSPVWANYGTTRGLPVSCNGSFICDTMEGILSSVAEIGMMTKHGAGTSAYFGAIRKRGSPISAGGESSGPVHFMELFDKTTKVVSQSNIRRGAMAAYLPIDHPDILDFLKIKAIGNPIQELSIGVCISDEWMNSLVSGKDEEKLKVWGALIKKRFESGYPYIFFSDTANNNSPEVYRNNGLRIHASNLCSEIMLPSNENESFVCVLSSMNLLHYDEWKNTDAVETLTMFLDTVTEEYIDKTKHIPYMGKANMFAKNHRAIGLGVLGWHSLLQKRMIPFESMEAKFLNTEVFSLINKKTLAASKFLAEKYGEPPLLTGTGLRVATRIAIAPTKSSSIILGQVSEGIEPIETNYFVKKSAKGSITYKNPFLIEVLKSYDQYNNTVMESILKNGGSVQHLDFLSDKEKEVFKTFDEISPKEILIQASARQKFIDQGQSINLKISNSVSPKDVSKLLIFAWQNGIKSLYYQKGVNASQLLNRKITQDINSCSSCEG
jgi:ribonucleoside-diphosphate reductase alpha chain